MQPPASPVASMTHVTHGSRRPSHIATMSEANVDLLYSLHPPIGFFDGRATEGTAHSPNFQLQSFKLWHPALIVAVSRGGRRRLCAPALTRTVADHSEPAATLTARAAVGALGNGSRGRRGRGGGAGLIGGVGIDLYTTLPRFRTQRGASCSRRARQTESVAWTTRLASLPGARAKSDMPRARAASVVIMS